MDLVHPLAEQYAAAMSTPPDDLLQQIHAGTMATHPHAHMLSSMVQGKLLELFSRMVQPRYILEIGTFTGFSALCLAKGLQPGGMLHTIELRAEDAQASAKNIGRSALQNQIHLHTGNALDIIPELPYTWDLVFIDADKTGYMAYYDMLVPRLNKGGWMIADNVLFHGQVLDDEIKGKNAKAIDAFNRHVAADERTEQVMLTVRDGLLLIKKK